MYHSLSVYLLTDIWAVSSRFRENLHFQASPLAALRRIKCLRERVEKEGQLKLLQSRYKWMVAWMRVVAVEG